MRRFWSGITLQRKIIAIIMLTTLATFATVVPAVFYALRDGMREQRQRHLVGVKHLVESLMEDNRKTIRDYATLFGSDRQVKDNLYYYAELAGERVHPLNAIRHLVDAFEVSFIELGDKSGRVVANTENPDLYYIERSADVLVRAALEGNVVTGIEGHPNGYLLKAVAPVYHDEGQLIGTITTGIIMDAAFADMIRKLSGADIAIIDREGLVVVSTMPELPEGAEMTPADGRPLKVGQREFQVTALPFSDTSGKPLGSVLVMSEDTVPMMLNKVNLTMAAILLAISFVSISATFFILRRVLAPVQKLKEGAEKIGSGDFSHRLDIASADEIGSLSIVFNRMAANLQQMREMEEKLKRSECLASIGEFSASTAHELNNPIANIIGLLKVVRKNVPPDDPAVVDLELAIREASRCGAIVRALLMYTRMPRPTREQVDINRLVESSVAAVRDGNMEGKEILLRFEPGSSLPAVNVDPLQMEQVFRNILLNAVQAIDSRGEIHVRTAGDEGGMVSVSISDTGCGIKEEHREKVFYPFFTTKRTGEGTGLGLAVCYGIMQNHGGEIEVQSEPGKGSTFVLTLPALGESNGQSN